VSHEVVSGNVCGFCAMNIDGKKDATRWITKASSNSVSMSFARKDATALSPISSGVAAFFRERSITASVAK